MVVCLVRKFVTTAVMLFAMILLSKNGNKKAPMSWLNFREIADKMQKDGEPVWDQVTIDKLWVTTQREAMIESGPPPAEKPQPSDTSEQKAQKEQTKK